MKEIKTYRDLIKAQLDGQTVQYYSNSKEGWTDFNVTLATDIGRLDSAVNADIYRIKPTKPSIDWSHVSDEFNYLARDECGLFYLYGNKPKINNSLWCSVDHNVISADAFKSLQVGNCHWKDSLVERPRD